MGGLWAGAGAAITNVVAGFIPIQGGGWMGVLKGLASAYLVGFIAEKVVPPANAQLMAIGGFAGTAWGAVNMVLAGGGNILASFAPAPAKLTPTAAGAAAGGVAGFYDIAQYPYDDMGMGDLVEAPDEYADAAWPYPLSA